MKTGKGEKKLLETTTAYNKDIIIQWDLHSDSLTFGFSHSTAVLWLLKETLENGLSCAVSLNHPCDAPWALGRLMNWKLLYAGPEAPSWFSACLIHLLVVQILKYTKPLLCNVTHFISMSYTGKASCADETLQKMWMAICNSRNLLSRLPRHLLKVIFILITVTGWASSGCCHLKGCATLSWVFNWPFCSAHL